MDADLSVRMGSIRGRGRALAASAFRFDSNHAANGKIMNALTRWDPFKKTQSPRPTHKLGANRKELARKPRQRDANFSQSRDIREDRGERQMKTVRARQTMAHLTRGK